MGDDLCISHVCLAIWFDVFRNAGWRFCGTRLNHASNAGVFQHLFRLCHLEREDQSMAAFRRDLVKRLGGVLVLPKLPLHHAGLHARGLLIRFFVESVVEIR